MQGSKVSFLDALERSKVSFLDALERTFDRTMRCLELFLAGMFMIAVALNFINVVDRYVFNRSLFGADEIQIYIMVWITFVGAVVVTWRNQHLRMAPRSAWASPWPCRSARWRYWTATAPAS